MREITKFSPVEEHLKELLEEEISEAGSRLARAIVAEKLGLAELAADLREVAFDEAKHAAMIIQVLRKQKLKEPKYWLSVVNDMIEADSGATGREQDFVQIARSAGLEEEARLFEQLSKDEIVHVEKLRKIVHTLGLIVKPEI